MRSACFVGVTLFAVTVSAAPPPARVEVTFSTPVERTDLRLQGPGLESGGKACSIPCTLELRPGTYTVYVDSAGRTSSLPLHLRENSDVEVRPPSQSQRNAGIGLIVTGSVLVATGLFAFTYDTARAVATIPSAFEGAGGSKGYQSPAWVRPLEIAGLVGVVPILFGIGFLTTARPTAVVRARAETAHAPRAPSQRTALVFAAPTFVPGGAGLRLGWRF